MNFEKYIFVDFENDRHFNFDILDKKTKIVLLLGPNQTPHINWVQKAQPYGESIQWEQIEKGGKDALDFLLVYFLCFYLCKENNKDKEYFIYSRDKGYDPLIEYLQKAGHRVKRIVSFEEIVNNKPKNDKVKPNYNEDISKIKKNLSNIDASKRPKNIRRLIGHISALLKKPNEEVEKIIEEIINKKIIICEENKHIKYNLK